MVSRMDRSAILRTYSPSFWMGVGQCAGEFMLSVPTLNVKALQKFIAEYDFYAFKSRGNSESGGTLFSPIKRKTARPSSVHIR